MSQSDGRLGVNCEPGVRRVFKPVYLHYSNPARSCGEERRGPRRRAEALRLRARREQPGCLSNHPYITNRGAGGLFKNIRRCLFYAFIYFGCEYLTLNTRTPGTRYVLKNRAFCCVSATTSADRRIFPSGLKQNRTRAQLQCKQAYYIDKNMHPDYLCLL